jgi:hypothetical protein
MSNDYALIAALSVRVILDFDILWESARSFEEKLVESHMRVAFSVPEHQEFLQSVAPSEPLLAEAAAQILNQSNNFTSNSPHMISGALLCGLLV